MPFGYQVFNLVHQEILNELFSLASIKVGFEDEHDDVAKDALTPSMLAIVFCMLNMHGIISI